MCHAKLAFRETSNSLSTEEVRRHGGRADKLGAVPEVSLAPPSRSSTKSKPDHPTEPSRCAGLFTSGGQDLSPAQAVDLPRSKLVSRSTIRGHWNEKMALSWTDDLLVGHQQMDAQHRALFDLVVALLNARSPESRVLFAKALYDHTLDHFTFEELQMGNVDYPEAARHKILHKSLLKRLADITSGISDGSLDVPNLQEFIEGWLITHIVTDDADLAAYLRI